MSIHSIFAILSEMIQYIFHLFHNEIWVFPGQKTMYCSRMYMTPPTKLVSILYHYYFYAFGILVLYGNYNLFIGIKFSFYYLFISIYNLSVDVCVGGSCIVHCIYNLCTGVIFSFITFLFCI